MNNQREIRSIKRITDVSLMPDGTFDIGFVVGETPTKENPEFERKYLGKWNLPKEVNEVE